MPGVGGEGEVGRERLRPVIRKLSKVMGTFVILIVGVT